MKLKFGILILLSLWIVSDLKAQLKQGYPEWPLILRHHSNVSYLNNPSNQASVPNQEVDFKPNFLTSSITPPLVNTIPNQQSTDVGPSGAGFDVCGHLVFYVGHTGKYANEDASQEHQLKIFLADGTELTTSGSSGTRLDCAPRDNEIQVCKLPGYVDRWIMFYNKNYNNDFNGNYRLDEVLYSVFEITNGTTLTFINNQRDIALNPGIYYDYGKAASLVYDYTIDGNDVQQRFLYLKRDANNAFSSDASSSIVIDQFSMDENGIIMDPSNPGHPLIRSSGVVNKHIGYLHEDIGYPLELNEKVGTVKLATIFYSNTGSHLGLYTFQNHLNFSSAPGEFIDLNHLAICPSSNTTDNITNYTGLNWAGIFKNFYDFPDIYLSNFSKKIAHLEFSPNGKYLYVSHGGYVQGGYTNITYLGQIDLQSKVTIGPPGNTDLDYLIRLKVQGVPGKNFSDYDYLGRGAGNYWDDPTNSAFINYNGTITMEKAANNKIYMAKYNSNKLFCIKNPDLPFVNVDLLPVDILANEPENITLNPSISHPYVFDPSQSTTQADAFYLPDAVDQEEYGLYETCIDQPIVCTDCIGSFAPDKDKWYVLSAWVKEDGNAGGKTEFNNPEVWIDFPNSSPAISSIGPFKAKGAIIDGWQRVEEEFHLPPGIYSFIGIRLNCSNGNCYFDDLRVFPKDGSMKSYVYDPETLRLTAELDERNYATMYEYDEEGKLVRVKKETEKGIMTIKESKNNTVKKP